MADTTQAKDVMMTMKSWLSVENLMKNMPFFLLIVTLGILYIANAHYHLQLERKIDRKEDVIEELGWEYMSTKSEVMYRSKQSEVAKAVEHMGLKPLIEPPKVIEVKE